MKNILRFLVSLASLSFCTNPSLAQWVQTGLSNGIVMSFAISGTNIFAGLYGQGVYLSTDGGITWNASNNGLTNTVVNSLAIGGADIFAGTSGGVWKSTNLGATWTNVFNTNLTIGAIAINGTNIFAGGAEGLYLSTDNGDSWSALAASMNINYVYTLAASGTNVFAGTNTNGNAVVVSTDNGTSWTWASAPWTGNRVYALAICGTNVFAAAGAAGVFLSTDKGISWSAVNVGLTGQVVTSLAISGTNIFAGVAAKVPNSGVFLSTDNGTSWSAPAATGLTQPDVQSLGITGTDLFAGTYEHGIFRIPLSDIISTGPNISRVVFAPLSNGNLSMEIDGTGFGNASPFPGNSLPYCGNSNFIMIEDAPKSGDSWRAGNTGNWDQKGNDWVNVNIESWTDTKIVIDRFCGWYNQLLPNWRFNSGDALTIDVQNTASTDPNRGTTFQWVLPWILRIKIGAPSDHAFLFGKTDFENMTASLLSTLESKGMFDAQKGNMTVTVNSSQAASYSDLDIWAIDFLLGLPSLASGATEAFFEVGVWGAGASAAGDFIQGKLQGSPDSYALQIVVSTINGIRWATRNTWWPYFQCLKVGSSQEDLAYLIPPTDTLQIDVSLSANPANLTASDLSTVFNSAMYAPVQDGGYETPPPTLCSQTNTTVTGIFQYDWKVIDLWGTTAKPSAGISQSVYFGGPSIGSTQQDSIVVRNTSALTLTIDSVVSDNPEYTVNPQSCSIASSDSVKFYLYLTPTTSGAATGHILFYHSATPPSPSSVFVYDREAMLGSFSVDGHWNIISVPLIEPDFKKYLLYPSSISSAFAYNGGYVVSDTLKNGVGYWLRFSSAQNIGIAGVTRSEDTINTSDGWNLIGGLSSDIASSSITTLGTTISSHFYEYDNGYQMSDTLKAGKGYWVKTSGSGRMVLSSSSSALKTQHTMSSSKLLKDLPSLEFEDANNFKRTLYIGSSDNKELDTNLYELPPLPPIGIFDVRFGSQRNVEIASERTERDIHILVSSATYPLKICWNVHNNPVSAVLFVDGKKIPMDKIGSTSISKEISQIQLKLLPSSTRELPTEFALKQNYPNPFNPSTILKYQLPSDSRVSLKIYNLLGQVVASIVDQTESAGYKSVNWNASSFSSGIYFYRLEATSIANTSKTFTSVRKMILIK